MSGWSNGSWGGSGEGWSDPGHGVESEDSSTSLGEKISLVVFASIFIIPCVAFVATCIYWTAKAIFH